MILFSQIIDSRLFDWPLGSRRCRSLRSEPGWFAQSYQWLLEEPDSFRAMMRRHLAQEIHRLHLLSICLPLLPRMYCFRS